jgi:hypothetical protein
MEEQLGEQLPHNCSHAHHHVLVRVCLQGISSKHAAQACCKYLRNVKALNVKALFPFHWQGTIGKPSTTFKAHVATHSMRRENLSFTLGWTFHSAIIQSVIQGTTEVCTGHRMYKHQSWQSKLERSKRAMPICMLSVHDARKGSCMHAGFSAPSTPTCSQDQWNEHA